MVTLKKIDSKATFSVRHPVLRAGKPIESCFFDGDDDATTTHFGLFVVEKLVGVISVFKTKNAIFSADNQFQIRGMAVLEEAQGSGYGKGLLERAEVDCMAKKADLIWFNAREKAVPFYQKTGYEIMGEAFEIPDIGTHFILFKRVRQ